MQPLQYYYLRDPAAKDNSIAHAAAAPSNLDAATTLRSAGKLQLQNRISTPKRQKDVLKHFLKGILKGKLLAPTLRKSTHKSLSQP